MSIFYEIEFAKYILPYQNDNYKGCSSKEKWNNFYAKINEYIGDGLNPLHNIVAIGITDYLSIDNYKKVLQDRRLPDSVKLIVPNVELRIMPLAKKSPVNIHCIFNPEKIDILENTFFANLKIEKKDQKNKVEKIQNIEKEDY